jgi:2-polyprenyl-3-methyl-5-hydroxy-6-metoxy-1,4-benzoquinol methylase
MSTFCRICGDERLKRYLHIKQMRLDRCPVCGFVQVREEPDISVLNDIYSKSYFTHSKYADQQVQDLENRRRMNFMEQYVPAGASVLDAGCSTGDFIVHAKKAYNVCGVDLSEYAIEKAKEKNQEIASQLVAGRLEDSPFANVYFDAICLWDVVEHLWDPVATLSDLMSRLNDKGYLFISTPAIDALTASVLGKYWAFMTPPEHLSFFSKHSLDYLAKQLQSKIIRHVRLGKWANVAFIAYKLTRIMPDWFPGWLLSPLRLPFISGYKIYVPTGDIQYVVVQRL